jgi:hypothetical protein
MLWGSGPAYEVKSIRSNKGQQLYLSSENIWFGLTDAISSTPTKLSSSNSMEMPHGP